jgi:NAD(P)-dependent dehydrogenase (short-subunit alcohol dehydrogenase family)
MITDFTAADIPDQTGKTFFITGANTGLGFESAKAFAGKGGRVLVGARDPEKGEVAVNRIRKAHPNADVQFVRIDLADLESIREAAGVVAREPRLDVLLNNAGVMMNPKTLTKDGFESQFGINHLGHFALTAHLLPTLLGTSNSRIVNVSSNAHKMGDGDLYWDDINAEQAYSKQGRYSASKLANLLFTYELDRRLRAKGADTVAVAAHPGMADTELGRHYPGWARALLAVVRPVLVLWLNTAESGAWPQELAATHPNVQGGQYFGPSRRGEVSGKAKKVDSSSESKDPERARRLWDLSIEMTGVDPGL